MTEQQLTAVTAGQYVHTIVPNIVTQSILRRREVAQKQSAAEKGGGGDRTSDDITGGQIYFLYSSNCLNIMKLI